MASWNQVSNLWSAVTSQLLGHCSKQISNSGNERLYLGMSVDKRIYLVTWNVHGSDPPLDLSDLLSVDQTPLPDIYAIGLQEVGSVEWESAFLNTLKNYDYVRVKIRRLLGIYIMVFVKRSHLPYVCNIESEVTKTGFKGVWGNKGAASIRLDFMGMNLVVVNSHLAPHMEGIRDRIVNIDNIIDGQKFRDRDTDNIMDHDYVFWIGDLNFRLENISYNRTIDLVRNEDYKTLAQNDQLRLVMEEGLVFEGFREGELNFPPTYKFDAGTDNYDTSALQRIPSYTDRILYYFHDTQYGQLRLSARSVRYRCHSNYRISDHKPVSAVIDFSVMTRGISSPVTFSVDTEPWNKFATKEVVYTVRKDFTTSIRDWIGIYKADFVDLNSYVIYVWVSMSSSVSQASATSVKMTVQFTDGQLSVLPDGAYVLCYLTKKGSLCGISEPFNVGAVTET